MLLVLPRLLSMSRLVVQRNLVSLLGVERGPDSRQPGAPARIESFAALRITWARLTRAYRSLIHAIARLSPDSILFCTHPGYRFMHRWSADGANQCAQRPRFPEPCWWADPAAAATVDDARGSAEH